MPTSVVVIVRDPRDIKLKVTVSTTPWASVHLGPGITMHIEPEEVAAARALAKVLNEAADRLDESVAPVAAPEPDPS